MKGLQKHVKPSIILNRVEIQTIRYYEDTGEIKKMDKKILLIGICDDEKEALNQIAESIKESIREMELPIHTKCRLFLNGEGMYQAIEKDAFDLLFVDIEMPGLNGFQLVKKISMRRKMPCLVFVSAYESFVFDSQEYMPLWFVRKSSLKRDKIGRASCRERV